VDRTRSSQARTSKTWIRADKKRAIVSHTENAPDLAQAQQQARQIAALLDKFA
jgi:hypothetical protein